MSERDPSLSNATDSADDGLRAPQPDDHGGPGRRAPGRRFTRRRMLGYGLAAAVGGTLVGLELVQRGVLPGRKTLDELDGACSISSPSPDFVPAGQSISGRFFSHARNREVGYTIGYPPSHGPGSELALVIVLHGFGGDHASALGGVTLAQALAEQIDGRALAPMALVAADGGGGYWNAHPGDDPMAMLVDELLPMCQRRGLGKGRQRVGTMGISMGGYGAILLAEKHPELIAVAAAISPAVWTSYAQARGANPGAYASAADFQADDVVTHTAGLASTPVRVAAGTDDPFYPGVRALARALPSTAVVELTRGCHDGAFSTSQRAPSLQFLARHLA